MMTNVATKVLTTINAPYGANLSAHQLAAMIADPKSASACSAPIFSFFCEVSPALQVAFIKEMGVNEKQVGKVASQFAKLSGYALPLAA